MPPLICVLYDFTTVDQSPVPSMDTQEYLKQCGYMISSGNNGDGAQSPNSHVSGNAFQTSLHMIQYCTYSYTLSDYNITISFHLGGTTSIDMDVEFGNAMCSSSSKSSHCDLSESALLRTCTGDVTGTVGNLSETQLLRATTTQVPGNVTYSLKVDVLSRSPRAML